MFLDRIFLRLTPGALALLSALAIAAQLQPETVSILVSATDKYDRVITNLKKEDIKIFEEGKARQITAFESADALPISIEVLVDTSGSTRNQSAAVPILAKLFLELTVRSGMDRAAVTSFGKTVTLVQPATDDLTQLSTSIDKIVMQDAAGLTPMISTLRDAANRLSGAPGRRIILLVSDGFDSSGDNWRRMIQTLQRNAVAVYPMYCFCSSNSPLQLSLENWGSGITLAKETGGTAYLPRAGGAQAIERDLRQIAREIASQRVVSFQPGSGKNSQALRSVRIEVANPELRGLKFKYRQRFQP